MKDYASACERAATKQGLDPVSAALNDAYIPFSVDQTGGFTMVAHIILADDSYIGITAEDFAPQDAYLMIHYSTDPNDEQGTILADGTSLVDTIQTLRDFLTTHQVKP